MMLYDLINQVNHGPITGANTDITGITLDSRRVKQGFLFICIRGLQSDGHDYIEAAAANGAAAILCEAIPDNLPAGITMIKTADTRLAMAHIAANFHGRPAAEMPMLAVTGTNGKTSITYFMEAILRAWGKRAGVIGTSGARVGDEALAIPYATSTTPDPVELHQILRAMQDKGAETVVMEATSHALALRKLAGIPFRIGMFTNLTQDHLDFHGTMAQYAADKAVLFTQCETGVFNADDAHTPAMTAGATCRVITYGIDADCNYKAENITLSHEGIAYDVQIKGEAIHIESPVPGRFSVYNTLCVVAAASEMGIPAATIAEGLRHMKNVPGRIQAVPNNKGFGVIIDYAHTPDGVANILRAVRGFTKGRVITVIGCGGDRDKTKRPIMGEIAGGGSDYVILTSDNPRSENPADIIAEMEAGVRQTSCPYYKLANRREAIFEAVQMAQAGDNIILAGKGSEDYQEFENKRREPFDDARVAQEALEARE